MSIAYDWSIVGIKTYDDDSHTNIVKKVTWKHTGTHDTEDVADYVASEVTLNVGDLSDFTTFEDLTESQVIEWVKAELTQDVIDANERMLQARINKKINAVQYSAQALPWAPVTPTE